MKIENTNFTERATLVVEKLKKYYPMDEPGVSYLISKGDSIISEGAMGLSDIEQNVSLTISSTMRIGSISKTITAISVLKLVEEGKLDLNKPINFYSPKLSDYYSDVTLTHLLSHRSGLKDHAFDENLIPFIWQPVTINKIIGLQEGKVKDFPAGQQYNYVNYNYVLVAHIIEIVTGKSFIKFANEDIFKKNGMKRSYYDELDRIIPNRASLYSFTPEGEVKNSASIDLSHVSAAGAFLSTPRDLFHWIRLLVSEKLVKLESKDLAWTNVDLPDGSPTSYGLGFNISEKEGEKIVWHTGLTPGAQAAFSYAVESEILIILMSNAWNSENTGNLTEKIMELMLTGQIKSE